jgi:hypothetical protein
MTRQEIVKEKEAISYMILENIQERHDLDQLTCLLARQTWLSSENKEQNNEHAN